MMKLFPLDEQTCARLAREHGTPLFAYSAEAASENFRRLQTALPPRVKIAYAVKANPHPELLRLFASLGAGFDCASEGELKRVAQLDRKGLKILFAGPGKRRAEISLALSLGARLNAESWEDLVHVNELATELTKANIRVHPRFGSEEGGRIIGGSGASAFGVDEEDLSEFLVKTRALPRVQIAGLHVFIASNQRNSAKLLGIYEMVFELAKKMHSESNVPLDLIDLGGGLGVPYSETEPELDITALGQGLTRLLDNHAWFTGEVLIEPGRYLAASCGVYLVRLVRIKESRGEKFAILEGGINHLLRPVLTDQAFPVKVIGRSGAIQEVTLAGPLCTSLDRLGKVMLPTVHPGDLLAFGMAGAYGFTEGMTHFLSHPVPPEIWEA